MYVFSIIVGACVALFVGGWLLRRGRTGVAKPYVITTFVLLIANVLNLGGLISVEIATGVRWLLLALAPAAFILAVVAVKRDRDEVMGRGPGDREAVASAAILYGAGTQYEAGGGDAGGGMET